MMNTVQFLTAIRRPAYRAQAGLGCDQFFRQAKRRRLAFFGCAAASHNGQRTGVYLDPVANFANPSSVRPPDWRREADSTLD